MNASDQPVKEHLSILRFTYTITSLPSQVHLSILRFTYTITSLLSLSKVSSFQILLLEKIVPVKELPTKIISRFFS